MSDALITIASIFGGAILGATGTYFVCKSKQEQQIQLISRQHHTSTSELKQKLEENLRQACSQLQKQVTELEETAAALRGHLDFREHELDLVSRCEQNSFLAKNSTECWQKLLQDIKYLFDKDECFTVVFPAHSPYDPIASSNRLTLQDKLTTALLQVLPKAIDTETNRVQVCTAEDVPDLQDLCPQVTRLVIAPIGATQEIEDVRHGLIMVALSGESGQIKMRWLRKVLEIYAHALFRIKEYEEEVRVGRIDPLTQLPNGRALTELLPHILEKTTEECQTSCLIIECDNMKPINEKYGTLVGDELIKEVAALIPVSSRVEELSSENKQRPADHLIRYLGTQFVLIMEDTDAQFAQLVAERVRAAVAAKTDWYGSVPTWSVSIGFSTAPADDTNHRMLLLKAEVALMYVKEKLGGNQAISFMQVPRHYRTSKLSARVGGSLNVFDPFSVLQSMAMARKNGILTVEEGQTGKRFWALFEGQLITKAHLGHLHGDAAVTEFLSTFESGDFNFQEYSALDKETMEEIHRMGESFSVNKPTDKHLIHGSFAQEKLASARRLITSTRLYVRPAKDFSQIVAGFARLKDAPTREELEVMAAISKHINGRTMLANIMDRLDQYPTYLRWHCSAFLLQNGAIELSKIALSISAF